MDGLEASNLATRKLLRFVHSIKIKCAHVCKHVSLINRREVPND